MADNDSYAYRVVTKQAVIPADSFRDACKKALELNATAMERVPIGR